MKGILYVRQTHYFLLLTLTLLLGGCGFHLRGYAPIPEPYQRIAIESKTPFGRYEQLLKRSLHDSGAHVLESNANYDLKLKIIDNKLQRTILAVGSDARVQEFRLTQTLLFQILDAQEQPLSDPIRLTETETYVFERDLLLGKEEEEALIREEIRKDLVAKMMYRLQGLLRTAHEG